MRTEVHRWLGIIAGLGALLTSGLSWGVIPTNALMKVWDSANGVYVFKTNYVVNSVSALQTRIDKIAAAASTKGGVVFLKSGVYTVTNTITLHGQGVQIVGLRDPATGDYPTLQYGDTLNDTNYNAGSSNPTLNYRAVLRVKGGEYTNEVAVDSLMGIYGLNIEYTGTNTNSSGGKATAIAMHRPDSSLFHDITIIGAYNGIDIGACMHPRFRNVNILELRGNFGMRCGIDGQLSDPIKVHGVTVSATNNTTAELIRMSTNMELIGADLEGGKVGISIDGPSWGSDLSNVFIRSVLIENPAQQGILVQDSHNVYVMNTQVNNAGREAIRVEGGWDSTNNIPYGFRGGMQIANFRAENSGYSAIRVQNGMNISIANAVLLNSGQNKASAPAGEKPIAGLYVDGNVTSLNVVGARIGTSSGTSNEDWGIYWSTNIVNTNFPWHSPKVTVGNVNFFSNIGTTNRTNSRGTNAIVEISNINGYYTLYNAGYFDAPPADIWTNQCLATDPDSWNGSSWFAPVKGFNMYDLPEIRDAMWINLLAVTNVTDTNIITAVKINSTGFDSLLDEAVAAYTNVVLYLPAGQMISASTYQRRIYTLDRRLLIDSPNVQLLGDGLDVTYINIAHQTTNTAYAPRDNAIKIYATSNSGIFGLTVDYSKDAAKPSAGPTNSIVTAYNPPFRVQSGSQNIRLANLGSSYSMGGGISIVDSKNVELYNLNLQGCMNIDQPATTANPIVSVIGTTAGAAEDIRMYQVFGGFLGNLWITNSVPAHWTTDNGAEGLAADKIPELTWVELKGAVNRVRADYSTFIQGKNGLKTLAAYSSTPQNISVCRFSVDHIYERGAYLDAVTNADFYGSWMNGKLKNAIASGMNASGNIRLFNCMLRSFGLEGICLSGGTKVSLVNNQTGNDCNMWTGCQTESRPFSGVYIGNGVGSAAVIGGMSGWIFNSDAASMSVNANEQDWGIVLGNTMTNYAQYGVALYGNGGPNAHAPASPPNVGRGLGRQTAVNSTNCTFITDSTNY